MPPTGPPVEPPVVTPPPAPPYRPPVNTLATQSLVFAFVFPPVGAVLGHLALAQIRRTGELGRNRALAGVTLSYVFITLTVVRAGRVGHPGSVHFHSQPNRGTLPPPPWRPRAPRSSRPP